MQIRQAYDPLREWVVDESIRSWSPANDRVRSLWAALTGDALTAAPSWAAYAEGVGLRNDFAHRAAPVSKEQAERFVTAAEQLMEHMVDVLAVPPREWPP